MQITLDVPEYLQKAAFEITRKALEKLAGEQNMIALQTRDNHRRQHFLDNVKMFEDAAGVVEYHLENQA